MALSPLSPLFDEPKRAGFIAVGNTPASSAVIVATLVDALDLDSSHHVMIDGDVALITQIADGITSVDISDPNNPVVLDFLGLLNNPSGLALNTAAKYAYVSIQNAARMDIVDYSNPGSLSLVTSFSNATLSTATYEVIKDGNYLYTTSYGSSRVCVINASTPGSLSIPGSVTDATALANGFDLAKSGNYVYVGCNNANGRLTVVDVTNPAAPVVSRSIELFAAISSVTINGNWLYAGNSASNVLYIVDITTPTSANLVSRYPVAGMSGLAQLEYAGGRLYCTQDGVMTVLDVSTPAVPRQLYQVSNALLGSNGFAVEGGVAVCPRNSSDSIAVCQVP